MNKIAPPEKLPKWYNSQRILKVVPREIRHEIHIFCEKFADKDPELVFPSIVGKTAKHIQGAVLSSKYQNDKVPVVNQMRAIDAFKAMVYKRAMPAFTDPDMRAIWIKVAGLSDAAPMAFYNTIIESVESLELYRYEKERIEYQIKTFKKLHTQASKIISQILSIDHNHVLGNNPLEYGESIKYDLFLHAKELSRISAEEHNSYKHEKDQFFKKRPHLRQKMSVRNKSSESAFLARNLAEFFSSETGGKHPHFSEIATITSILFGTTNEPNSILKVASERVPKNSDDLKKK